MKGFVATPPEVANRMVELLFDDHPPSEGDRILFPGVGEGPFVEAVYHYCESNEYPFPTGYACDTHQERLETAQSRFEEFPVEFVQVDFLDMERDYGPFEYIIGNPPYVPITEIDEQNKQKYRKVYQTATGRFDLYLLFFERALKLLANNGRLTLLTPEKFEYTETARPLRQLLETYHLERLEHLDDATFKNHITYPTISVVATGDGTKTTIASRDEAVHETVLPTDGTRWTAHIRDIDTGIEASGMALGEITKRISPGMATGADSVFVFDKAELPTELESWSVPTVSGNELKQHSVDTPVTSSSVFLCPYDDRGNLVPESELGEFGNWLEKVHRSRLEDRSCYKKGHRRWYAWHENPPMEDLLQQKILFRDIASTPQFWLDDAGTIIPRHSVYYILPKNGIDITELRTYLNSPEVARWLHANCQRAHSGYLRLQSRVLEELPVPARFSTHKQTMLETSSE